jgi:hypothetical protein
MKLFYTSLFLLLPFAALSQVGKKGSVNLSSGVDVMLPSSRFATTNNQGFGLSLKTEYVFARHISTTVSGSYYRFAGDEAEDLHLIPLLAGLRYYLGNFYLGAEAGTGLELRPGNENGFMYAFSVGDEIITGRQGNSLDISFRIQNWQQETTRRFYGLRIAYEFRIR